MAESSSAAAPEEDEEESGLLNAVDAVPFMLHVLLVFVIAWLLFPFTSHGFFLMCLGILYLVQVEKRGREIERRRIASAERRKMNTRRTFDEGETARWLNEAIKGIWPVCMEKFASKHLFGPMAPYFLDKYKPTWIVKEAKMDIESLRLGSRPPVFNFIRALEKPPDGDHVAYEADMDFLASNDMNAEMSVLMRGGARTTFYISNLHIEGKVRISVKFLKGWPVVSRVRFCFASTPQVTMSYTPYYKNFPDVSLIPMVANVVMKTLDSAMVDSIVEPNMLVVDIEALASMLSPNSQGAPATYVPKVENKPTLLVEILEATDLKVADRNGFSDPFVDIQFGLHKKKTKYIRKTLNPKWENEQHQFTIVSWDMPNLLTLRMRDWNRLRPSYDLGIYTVSVNELYQDGKLHDDGTLYEYGKRYVFNRRLEKVSRGHLRFAITVNHTRPPQAFEEPSTSDAVRETVTQEIQSAVDYAVYDSPVRGTSTEMKRSKSDTNLTKHARTLPKRLKGKSKQSSQTPTHESPTLEALQEQATVDEAHDVITMPYGPHGAFRIFHPGSVQASPPAQAPLSTAQAQPIPTPPALVDEPEAVRPPSSRLRNPFRGFVRKRKPSHESVLTETMSERSGSLGSIDFSTELKNLELAETYHGPVRMDLIDTSVAPEEPPEMFVPRSGPMLEPIMSGKPTSTAPAPNSHSAQVPTTDEEASQPLEQVEHQGSPVASDGSKLRAGKPAMSRLPKIWYQKIKSLAAKAGKRKEKKLEDGNGVAYSSELKYPSGEDDHEGWDPTVSRSESMSREFPPLDAAKHNGGESSELRKLVQETPQSRAAGSQSDRSDWPSKLKQRLRHQSQSLRFESLHLRPKLHAPDSALNSIPERPNGKVSV